MILGYRDLTFFISFLNITIIVFIVNGLRVDFKGMGILLMGRMREKKALFIQRDLIMRIRVTCRGSDAAKFSKKLQF